MFIRETALKRMMKDAWKGVGLRIVNKELSYVLTGRKWFLEIFKANMPKEILGQVFALAGELPDQESQFLANADGNQQEIFGTPSSDIDVYMNALKMQAEENTVRAQDVLVDSGWTVFRIYKDEEGNIYPVPESIHNMISKTYCEEDEEYYGAFMDGEGWVYWISTSGAFGISSHEHSLDSVDVYDSVKELFRRDADEVSEDED